MTFSHPVFFYIALALTLALPLGAVLAQWRRSRDLRRWADPALLARLSSHLSPVRRIIKLGALLAGLWLLTLALAGPQWGSRMVEVRRQGRDVFIALDVSRSMLAEDIKPNRLLRAQQELGGLIDRLNGDRIGILAFAGSAYLACPLTTDYEAAKMFLSYVSPESVPLAGTSLGSAIRLAAASFPKGGEGFRVLVLLTDGEDHRSEPLAAAQEAKAAGIRILSIGFGTAAGEPIPIKDDAGRMSGYVKDAKGESVVSRLDEGLLKQLTQTTGGAYYPAADGSLEADKLAELIGQMQKRDVAAGAYGAQEDRFQYLLAPALLLLLAGLWLPLRKQAWLWSVLLALCLSPGLARADVASDVNSGNRAYAGKRYPQALQKYQDAQIRSPENGVVQYDLGNAYFRLGKWAEAEQAYRQALKSKDGKLRAKSWYNLGNTFLQQRKYAEAIDPYRQALKLDPGDADALHNLALALRFLKQPPQKQDPSQNKQDQKQDQGGQAQKEQQSKQEQAKAGAGEKQKGPDDRGEQGADQAAAKEQEQKSGESAQAQAPKPGDMSREEAENLLEAVKEAEREARRQRLSGIYDRGRGRAKTAEDW